MSLLKWKEMAEKRSELGKRINTVRETMKQKTISDQMGQVEAAKLFEPITSGLMDLTAPKTPLRRMAKKKGLVPDYALEIGDDEEVPDYGLEDLFGEEVKQQEEKQLAPKPPSYEDVLKDIALGEKMDINPEYAKKYYDVPTEFYLPPEYDDEIPEYEEEGPDYAIIEEDQTNQILDKLNIPNYNNVELRLTENEMDNKKRKAYLNKILNNAKDQRFKLTGYSTQITKKLKKGLINEAEAQMGRKVIKDTRKILNDYINYNNQKLINIKGSGLRKTKRGGQVQFFNNPIEMIKKLELIIGSMVAGNNSIELRNTGVALLDILLKNSILNRPQYNKIYKNYFM